MTTIKTNQQRTIWEFFSFEESLRRDGLNKLGPYKVELDTDFGRHFDCPNYDACLAYAAQENWNTFSCVGCRRTDHGKFVSDPH